MSPLHVPARVSGAVFDESYSIDRDSGSKPHRSNNEGKA